jgi:hypothetical protein
VKQQSFWKIPFHPVILAVYPVMSLLANNLDQVRPQVSFRAFGICLAAGILLYLVLALILRNREKAALLASFWLVLFFSYGHIYQLLEGDSIAGFVYGKHRFLTAVWLVLFLAGSLLIIKKLKRTQELNQIFNIVSLALLVLPAVQILSFEARYLRSTGQVVSSEMINPAGSNPVENSNPDIYYIILDGYSRADVMEDLYGLDIKPFMEELQSIGFVFPECAQSNYGLTAFSMFASLNMNYLDAYGDAIPLGSDLPKVDYETMRGYLSNNEVRRFLKEEGYQMITFETGFWWLNIDDTDLYIVENNNPLKKYSQSYSLSNFEDLFIRTTALRVISEANAAVLGPMTRKVKTPAEQHYEWVKFALDELDKVPEIPGQKFVYFHVLAPHDPHVFAPDGSFQTAKSEGEDSGYKNEVIYLNKRMVEIVRNLIAESETPPIIILQGDHGWSPLHRMEILNAYYLPGGGGELVYPTITPVNTFRLILNRYFGANFELLKDASYFSVGGDFPKYGIRGRPYQLTPVPITCMEDQ